MKQRLKQQEFQEKLKQKQDLNVNELQLGTQLTYEPVHEISNNVAF